MHGSSVNLGLHSSLDKAIILIVSPLLSGSAIGDLITLRPFTPIGTVPSDCGYHYLCNLHQMICHSWLKSIIHLYHCLCSFHQTGCLQWLKSPVFPGFGIRDFPFPRMTAGNVIELTEHWFEGASFLSFANSPVCSKQFHRVKAKSWT